MIHHLTGQETSLDVFGQEISGLMVKGEAAKLFAQLKALLGSGLYKQDYITLSSAQWSLIHNTYERLTSDKLKDPMFMGRKLKRRGG